jgi:hypothetical protein
MKHVAAGIAFLLTAWLGWHAIEFHDDWVLAIYVLVVSIVAAGAITRLASYLKQLSRSD